MNNSHEPDGTSQQATASGHAQVYQAGHNQ